MEIYHIATICVILCAVLCVIAAQAAPSADTPELYDEDGDHIYYERRLIAKKRRDEAS